MKKTLLALGAVMLLGAGCFNGPKVTTVEGNWYLAFDLPEGWIMVEDYAEPTDQQVNLDYEVDGEDDVIKLQNTDKPIVFSDDAPDDSVPAESYTQDGAAIKVTRLDPRRLIPDEAEDLGDGFFKTDTAYYLDAGEFKYQFEVDTTDEDLMDEIEEIILSAETVTNMTSTEDES